MSATISLNPVIYLLFVYSTTTASDQRRCVQPPIASCDLQQKCSCRVETCSGYVLPVPTCQISKSPFQFVPTLHDLGVCHVCCRQQNTQIETTQKTTTKNNAKLSNTQPRSGAAVGKKEPPTGHLSHKKDPTQRPFAQECSPCDQCRISTTICCPMVLAQLLSFLFRWHGHRACNELQLRGVPCFLVRSQPSPKRVAIRPYFRRQIFVPASPVRPHRPSHRPSQNIPTFCSTN